MMTSPRDTLLGIIRDKPDRLTRRDIARALGIKGDDRRELRMTLRAMIEDGTLILSSKKTYREANALPAVMVITVSGIDEHGDMIGRPERWMGEGEAPTLIIREGPISKKSRAHDGATLGVGGRALCRIKVLDNGDKIAQVMKKLARGPSTHLGILYQGGRGWRIKPVDKKARDEYRATKVPQDCEDQTLVMYRASGRKNKYERNAEIVDILGPAHGPKAASLISLHQHGIQIGFDDAVINAAKALTLPELGGAREDLRALPLLTIDPVDAKDFDDAVYAAPDTASDNKNGWIIWVAIADVAAFVTPDSALDKAARLRGNSVYLPDRVEPMLPEALSADLCSLRPHEDRACMAIKMRISAQGVKKDHSIHRGLMRSHARLTYAQAQEAFDGHPGATAQTVSHTLEDIFCAYKALRKARTKRAPLAIDLPERRIHVSEKGEVTHISLRERFDAHKLVEEFMIQANVAAAEALEHYNMPAIVRVHEPPSREKLQGLSDFLPALGLKWAIGERASTTRFNTLLGLAAKKDLSETIGMAVLRTQSQAYYGSDAKGHFGLNLTHYAHFTSPIRRYADLVVHRALIRACDLGDDGTTDSEISRLKEISEHISNTERKAMAAERDAKDRYIARYMEGRVGVIFDARITGVTKFGLFITLDETGADGLIPARSLGREYFVFEEKSRRLVGEESGDTFRFGRKVKVKLEEADALTGGLIFEMISQAEKGKKPKRSGRRTDYKRGGRKPQSGHQTGRRRR